MVITGTAVTRTSPSGKWPVRRQRRLMTRRVRVVAACEACVRHATHFGVVNRQHWPMAACVALAKHATGLAAIATGWRDRPRRKTEADIIVIWFYHEYM